MDRHNSLDDPRHGDGQPRKLVSVLLSEPHEVARRGLEQMLASLSLVGRVDAPLSTPEAIDVIGRGRIDVAIVSSDWDGTDIDAIVAAAADAGIRILLLLRSSEPGHVSAATRHPVDGFLLERDLTLEALESSIRHVSDGMMFLPVAVARRVFSEMHPEIQPAPGRPLFTPRETQALVLLVNGLSNKQIGRRLGISEHGAKRLVANVCAKLNSSNRTLAVARALREGLVSQDTPTLERDKMSGATPSVPRSLGGEK